jgi:hypothetical protein
MTTRKEFIRFLNHTFPDIEIGLGAVHKIKHPRKRLGSGITTCNDKVEDTVHEHVIRQDFAIIQLHVHEELQQVFLTGSLWSFLSFLLLPASFANHIEGESTDEFGVVSQAFSIASPPILER